MVWNPSLVCPLHYYPKEFFMLIHYYKLFHNLNVMLISQLYIGLIVFHKQSGGTHTFSDSSMSYLHADSTSRR